MADAFSFIKKAVGDKEKVGAKVAGALKNSPPTRNAGPNPLAGAIERRLKKKGVEGSAKEEASESKAEALKEGDK